jgi:hypothetical protein
VRLLLGPRQWNMALTHAVTDSRVSRRWNFPWPMIRVSASEDFERVFFSGTAVPEKNHRPLYTVQKVQVFGLARQFSFNKR